MHFYITFEHFERNWLNIMYKCITFGYYTIFFYIIMYYCITLSVLGLLWSEYTEDFYDVVMEAIAYGQITIEEGYDRLMKRADEVRADLK